MKSPTLQAANEITNLAEIEPAAGNSPPNTDSHKRMVFTDRNGRFDIHGLPHGHYQLILGAPSTQIIPFEVTHTPEGVVELGHIQVDMMSGREYRVLRPGAVKFVSGSGVLP